MNAASSQAARRRRDLTVAAACAAFAAAMVGMAYAAVPLYNWFCRTTGFAGTTQVATAAPGTVLDRRMEVRFDANVTGGLPWRFEPEQTTIVARIGDVVTVSYMVTNESARETAGLASFNVTPPTAGAYFSKINCFCFTEQRLKPGETREMPVVFFIDPALAKDSEQDGLTTITLSYTMYPVRLPEPPRAERGPEVAPGRS
ncbi:MAG: cytochrome c oxidase assembly protein subunit 11 [Alphaproteobacteria bacterium]|jgi:cytochrome c oxidase assembly protein subunit 11|nr:cytochrome c oxidase assembly protein subunit 11 [Alphaproteobacteria bacterium]